MRIFYSDRHRKRNARTELHGGELVRPFEGPFRMEFVLDGLREAGLEDLAEPAVHDLHVASQLHDESYLDFLQSAWPQWKKLGHAGEAIPVCFPARRMQTGRPPRDIEGALGYYSFGSDTSLTDGSWEAAQAAMDCALSAAEHVEAGAGAAFALCRPPGHHASIDQFGGYCFLNNAAIAAQQLRNAGMARIGVLDVDFHHGNGTQDIFYRRGDVFFASIHGDPLDAFPHFLGFADETGEGEGQDCNCNYPLPPGTPFAVWSAALDDALNRIRHFGAEALVVSLGVDAFEKDPISFFRLASEDFRIVGRKLADLKLPTVFCMEGGYGVREIGVNVANVLTGFEERAVAGP